MRSKTIGHIHPDPILVYVHDSSDLFIGQFLCINPKTGFYEPARSDRKEFINVIGYIWSIPEKNYVYVKTGFGPIKRNAPLPKEYFIQTVGEYIPNPNLIPGNYGDVLYLGANIKSQLTNNKPPTYPIILGYKTEYGINYQPEVLSHDSNVASFDEQSECLLHFYQVCCYVNTNGELILVDSKTVILYELVPNEFVNSPLIGCVSIEDYDSILYLKCQNERVICTFEENSNPTVAYGFKFNSDNNITRKTIIKPLMLNSLSGELYSCVDNIFYEEYTVTGDCNICCEDVQASSSSSSSSSST